MCVCVRACVLQSWEGLTRIASTPTPFVYRHLLAVMLVTFVYSFPFAYVASLQATVIPVSYMFCFMFYGVATLSQELENPLGWDLTDLDLEGFQVHNYNHTHAITTPAHTRYLLPPLALSLSCSFSVSPSHCVSRPVCLSAPGQVSSSLALSLFHIHEYCLSMHCHLWSVANLVHVVAVLPGRCRR